MFASNLALQKAAPTVSKLSGLEAMQSVAWIDWTALVIIVVFFFLGLSRGFFWQASRILSLIASYAMAALYGPQLSGVLAPLFSGSTSPEEMPLYVAYVLLFLVTLVLLSVAAHYLQKLVKKSGMTFYDRMGGAVLGIGTGGIGVIFILSLIYMFVPDSLPLVQAAQRSHSMEMSQKTMRLLGSAVPKPMQQIFEPKPAPLPGEVPR